MNILFRPQPLYRSEMILAEAMADVTGDGIADTIVLRGYPPSGDSPFLTEITLIVTVGATPDRYVIPLPTNAGYHPTLFIGDFTGDKVDDVLVSIDSGGSGAITYNDIYTFTGGEARLIFDSEYFNSQWNYQVEYLDNYKLKVTSEHAGLVFVIDITGRGPDYLNEIYNPDGTLKQPIQGMVEPVSGLFPVDLERDGTYELMLLQAVSGRYRADRFGYMTTVLRWNGAGWTMVQQWFSIYGANVS
ncbi:spore coat protein [Paenibacillus sp. CAA11]|uniref:spore coat protein n=1 Tax=Paenibacillus sp. CAA11 TaxID=1532905 RepID=UPI000D3B0DBB|nr:spore coat protein [Paenibacillus sp. CAA11]AWB46174.1 spore coat protein [Paenibacillus sp. CAA11]